MRAIAEEAFEMVREYKGSHSGEHGDGIVRSEFHEKMYGDRLVKAFSEIKSLFDPRGLLNPGRIVDPPKMDDRSLFRYKPNYQATEIATALDWSDWIGLSGAVEMCNNNGACRKVSAGVMCPSYRVTKDEKHVTRGRANTLRLALSGQLGPDAISSKEMSETMELCVSCKACRRECPTGVDMAKMKIEHKSAYVQKNGLSMRDRLVGYLPKYAKIASKYHYLSNLRNKLPGLPWLTEQTLGFSKKRTLPVWNKNPFKAAEASRATKDKQVVLMADTFNTYFEPENLRSALRVLERLGYQVHVVNPLNGDGQSPCCGRTYFSVGLVEKARAELSNLISYYLPYIEQNIPIVGLEPSCLNTLRDEALALGLGADAKRIAAKSMMLEGFLLQEIMQRRISFKPVALEQKVLLHGHCHQKAFGDMGSVEQLLRQIPDLDVDIINSSCCGMAGAFGYEAEHYETSIKMAELDLLPAVRDADKDCLIVADGTSCRHQISDGAHRKALHVAQVLDMVLE